MGCSPEQMEKAIIKNLKEKTGKTLEEWIEILRNSGITESKEQLKYLKENQRLGHGQAKVIIKKYNNDSNVNYDDSESNVNNMFKNYPDSIKLLYNKFSSTLLKLGEDVKLRPCKTYLPFYRKHQFVVVKPTKDGLRVGLALSEDIENHKLSKAKGLGSAKINYEFILENIEDFDKELSELVLISYSNN